jgi:hypothetical protein
MRGRSAVWGRGENGAWYSSRKMCRISGEESEHDSRCVALVGRCVKDVRMGQYFSCEVMETRTHSVNHPCQTPNTNLFI